MENLPALRASSAALLAGIPAPESPGRTVSERFIPGSEGAPDVRVLLYGSAQRTQPTAGLLRLHGGGYVSGGVAAEDIAVSNVPLVSRR